MNEYKRLTKVVNNGVFEEVHIKVNDKVYDPIASDLTEMALRRLAELEDKIENGTLIELPCKLGQVVYKIYDKCKGSNCPYTGNYGQWRCHYKEKQRCDAFIDEVSFTFDMIDSIGRTIFLNIHEAEQNLERLNRNEL